MTVLQLRNEVSVPTQLAWSVLFGEEFLRSADPRLLQSFQDDPAAWGRLILDTWSMFSTLGGQAPSRPEPQPETAPIPTATPIAAAGPTAPHVQAPAGGVPAPAVASTADSSKSTDVPSSVVASKENEPDGVSRRTIDFFDPDEDEAPPPVKGAPTVEEVKARLVELVAEVSGYPPEIFDDNLDLEVDLGIDSIKQVETLARVREQYGLTMDEGFLIRDYATIGKMADYIASRISGGI